MKRILSALLAAVLAFACFAIVPSAAENNGTCGAAVTWTLEDGKLTISGSGAMQDYTEKNNFTPWKEQADSITSLVIGEGVTSVGNYAFSLLSSLSAVSLPSTLTSIGDGSFGWCMALPEISIPDSVSKIGEYAFTWCSLLKTVNLPKSLKALSTNAFYFCNRLTGFTVSQGNTAFSVTDGMLLCDGGKTLLIYPAGKTAETVTLPSGIIAIKDAFFYCGNIKYVHVPASVESLGKNAFYSAAALEQITFASGSRLSSVGENAFYGCKKLGEISLPDGLREIGNGAFKNCTSLYCAEIPASAAQIADDAFTGCKVLKISVVADSYAQKYAMRVGVSSQFYARVMLNGNEIKFDQMPLVQNGRTLVPLRKVCEALGAEVVWNGQTRTATVTKGDTVLQIPIGGSEMTKNGEKVALDVPAQILGSRTLVPVRAVSESFGLTVEWDSVHRIVLLTAK